MLFLIVLLWRQNMFTDIVGKLSNDFHKCYRLRQGTSKRDKRHCGEVWGSRPLQADEVLQITVQTSPKQRFLGPISTTRRA